MIGLRGLLAEALERGDHAGACATAERAFARAPQAEWAFRSFLRLSAEAGRWDDVLRVLDDGSRRGFLAHASAARVAALLARSGARRRMGERERADEDVLEAAKLDFLGPAAMSEAAKVWIARGKAKKAEKMLAEAWRISPHPALAEAYDLCAPNAGRETRAERLIALSKSAPDADESRLLRATQFASLHRWSDARDALEPLLESPRPGRRAYRVMADLTLGESGDIDAARAWYDRALGAPADDDLQGWRPGVGFDLGGLGGLRLFLEAAGLAPSAAAREGWSDDVGGAGASGLLEARGEGSGHALVPRDAH